MNKPIDAHIKPAIMHIVKMYSDANSCITVKKLIDIFPKTRIQVLSELQRLVDAGIIEVAKNIQGTNPIKCSLTNMRDMELTRKYLFFSKDKQKTLESKQILTQLIQVF